MNGTQQFINRHLSLCFLMMGGASDAETAQAGVSELAATLPPDDRCSTSGDNSVIS
jgi:hypothetical protein